MPTIEGGRVCMLLGVSNNLEGYSEQDVHSLQSLADTIWQRTTQRRQEAIIHRLSEALDQSPSPVIITDTGACILYVNKAFTQVSGYTSEEVLGCNPRLLQSGLTPRSSYEEMWSRLPKGLPWQGELINRRKNGQSYVENASLYPIRDAFGEVTHYVAHKEDISLRRESEERIRALSNFDTLTGLSNKKSFEEQLRATITHCNERHELFLVFQPQCKLGSGTLKGAEALLRWRHPHWGMVSPAEFIPIAEQNGAIVSIDLWVLEHAAQQLRIWDSQGLPELIVAVNVSAMQFARPHFVEEVLATLQKVGVDPKRIEIELTEAVALKQPEQAELTILKLHTAGFQVALDDFGTGYSSMSYLKRYAIDKLKIDQSFVRDLAEQPNDQAIVTAIIRMAQSLGLRTIAEGVETAEQAKLLQDYGCDDIQGYWYSKPLEPHDFSAFCKRNLQMPEPVDKTNA